MIRIHGQTSYSPTLHRESSMTTRSIVVIAIAAILHACIVLPATAQDGVLTELAEPVVEIPMNLATKHIAVEVFIDGSGMAMARARRSSSTWS